MYHRYILLLGAVVTDNPQFEDLTDLGTGGHLTFKLARIAGVGEFELEGVLSSPRVGGARACRGVFTCLETCNAKIRCKPDGDQLKSLVVDIFFVADEERIAVRISHPGYLALAQLKLYNLSFADFTKKNLCR